MSKLLSDKNAESKSSVVSRRRQYSDLDLSLSLHPDFKDITPIVDIDAVKQSVKHLVLTNFNERPFRPDLGSNIRALLFEPDDNFTRIMLRESIIAVLRDHEPRVDNVKVTAISDDSNGYHVTVAFRIVNIGDNVETDIYLERIR